jgi:HupE/UreJ protein
MKALLVLVLLAGIAEAHPADVAYLRVDVAGSAVALQLDVDVNLAAGLVGLDPHAVDDTTVRSRAGVLVAATYRLAPLAGCAWRSDARAELHGRTVRLLDRAECGAPVHALRWSLPFASHASSVFQLLVKVRGLGDERVAIVDRTHPDLDVTGTLGLLDFVHTGVAHIGVAPSEWHTAGGGWKLPDGIDHILFVLALLLGGGSIRRLVGVATGFTLGHSVTLALATLGVVRPPAGLIEPLIALSIVIVAAEAMTGRLPRQRWRVATAFGLVHGFGFARALDGLELTTLDTIKALFGYNLGVELGQLAIVAVAAPLVLWAHRHPRGRLATRALGALIMIAGMFWVIQRVIAAL